MGKLPHNLVQPPVFDSPLRRTTNLAVVDEPEVAPVQDPPIEATHTDSHETESTAAAAPRPTRRRRDASVEPQTEQPHPHRMTVRFSVDAWRALHHERLERTLAGEKTVSVSELVRELVDAWAKRKAKRG